MIHVAGSAKVVQRLITMGLVPKHIREAATIELKQTIARPQLILCSLVSQARFQLCIAFEQTQLLFLGIQYMLLQLHQLAAKLKYRRPDFLAIAQLKDCFTHLAGRLRTGQRTAQHIQHCATPSHVIWHREPTTGRLAA